jgi:hypothetical protein
MTDSNVTFLPGFDIQCVQVSLFDAELKYKWEIDGLA